MRRLHWRWLALRRWITAKFHLCKGCDAWWGVRWESSRTAYDWDGKGKNPNRPVPLCPKCAKDHHEYWNERWSDYYSGCL